MANVMLTLMHKIGLTDIAQFGDSTGDVLVGVDVDVGWNVVVARTSGGPWR